MGRHVAVKELHLPAGLGAEERRLFRERLLREARTAGRLNHPGIVTVYDVVDRRRRRPHRDGADRGPHPRRRGRRLRSAGRTIGADAGPPAGGRAGRGPRQRGGAPRRQAQQRDAGCARAGHADRLRDRPGRRRPPADHDRFARRVARLPGPGAAGGAAGDARLGPLVAGGHALPRGAGHQPVQPGVHRGHHLGGAARGRGDHPHPRPAGSGHRRPAAARPAGPARRPAGRGPAGRLAGPGRHRFGRRHPARAPAVRRPGPRRPALAVGRGRAADRAARRRRCWATRSPARASRPPWR